MKSLLVIIFLINTCISFAQKQKQVNIIFDTDIAPDYDDVEAMALLYAFADKGEACGAWNPFSIIIRNG